MESDQERVQAQLREIERGEVAAWVVYPPTPVWWPVLFGCWSAVFVLGNALLEDLWQALANLGLCAISLSVIWWDRHRRGAYPHRNSPPELNGPFLWLALMGLGVVAVGLTTYWLLGTWVAALLTGLATCAAVTVYEVLYARAAARTRARLG